MKKTTKTGRALKVVKAAGGRRDVVHGGCKVSAVTIVREPAFCPWCAGAVVVVDTAQGHALEVFAVKCVNCDATTKVEDLTDDWEED